MQKMEKTMTGCPKKDFTASRLQYRITVKCHDIVDTFLCQDIVDTSLHYLIL
jgi:hypothetical protein